MGNGGIETEYFFTISLFVFTFVAISFGASLFNNCVNRVMNWIVTRFGTKVALVVSCFLSIGLIGLLIYTIVS